MQILFFQNLFPAQLSKAIGWTLVHSIWLGMLAALVAGFIIICTRRTAARHRYNLLGLVLLVFIAATVVTFTHELSQFRSETIAKIDGLPSVTGNIIMENSAGNIRSEKTTIDKLVSFLNANADFIVSIWAVLFFFHCIKLLAGIGGVRRIRNYRTHPSPADWSKTLFRLSRTLGISQAVVLLQSEIVKVPVAVGWLKPVILVPVGLLANLPAEQVETILLHELAHVRRKDYLVNIIQRFVEAVFFFNPGVLWISSLLRQEREACCDDIVLSHTVQKGNYLEALISFQEHSLATSRYALALNSKKHYLLNRVKRMITRENKKLDVMEKIALAAGLIAFTAFTFVPQKDAADKTTITEAVKNVQSAKESPVTKEENNVSTPASRQKSTNQKNNRASVEVPLTNVFIDTVPPSGKKNKENAQADKPEFPNISTNSNDDGKTKTETTTVTDGSGKTYSFTKVNGKMTNLIVDGKTIPENEYGQYEDVLTRIELLREENKARRLASMERRKVAQAKREEDMRTRSETQILQRKLSSLEKQYLLEQKRQLRNDNNSTDVLEQKRKELLKLIEKLKQQNKQVPMLNGREIIKNDIHADYLTKTDVAVNTQTGKSPKLYKAPAIDRYVSPGELLLVNGKATLFFNSNLELKTGTTLESNVSYNSGDAKLFITPDNKIEKAKSSTEVEPLKKLLPKSGQPVPAPANKVPSKRRVTT